MNVRHNPQIFPSIRHLCTACLFLAAGALALHAEVTAPDGYVNELGQLVLPGLPPIDRPEGSVDGEGNLLIGDQTIPKPSASKNPDGSLNLGDQTLPVPTVPLPIFFSDTMASVGNGAWFSGILGWVWTTEPVSNWVYLNMFSGLADGTGGWTYIKTDIGNERSFWAYNIGLSDWIWIVTGNENSFRLLSEANAFLQAGWFFRVDGGWSYLFEEKDSGEGLTTTWLSSENGWIVTRKNAF